MITQFQLIDNTGTSSHTVRSTATSIASLLPKRPPSAKNLRVSRQCMPRVAVLRSSRISSRHHPAQGN